MMGCLLLHTNFDRIKNGLVCSHTGNPGRIHGYIRSVRGHDGANALYFTNPAGGRADQYVDFGPVLVGVESFTVGLWLKTHRDGCNGWPNHMETIQPEEFAVDGSRTLVQKRYGGVLLSNMAYGDDIETEGQTGFSLANLQQFVYFNTCVRGKESSSVIRLSGMKEVDDDRWHQLTIVFDRKESERVYLDACLIGMVSLQPIKGQKINGGNLILGADGMGNNGLGEVSVSSLCIWQGALSEEELDIWFAAEEIARLEEELRGRPLPPELYPCEQVDAMSVKIEKARKEAEKLRRLLETDYCGLKEIQKKAKQLKKMCLSDYETFLKSIRKPDASFLLLSDAHVEGIDGPRALSYGRALAWGKELNMDAFADCGDYSDYGKAEELDGYWDAVKKNRGSMAALVSVGNHETLEKSSKEFVAYHTGKLAENQAVTPGYQKLYYEYTLNGYHFLVLSQYSDTYTMTGYNGMWVHAADLKKEQMDWLEERLEACCGQGRPVFLFIHNAIRQVLDHQTDGNYREWAVIQSTWAYSFYELLGRYKEVVVCTGHVHHGFGENSGAFKTRDGYHVIDVPSFCRNHTGYGQSDKIGSVSLHTGYLVYLFGSGILLRAVEFERKKWLTAYDEWIEIGGE